VNAPIQPALIHNWSRLIETAPVTSVNAGSHPDSAGLRAGSAGEGAQSRVEPIYETIEGWKQPTAHARSWADLPAQAVKYVRRVEELVGCPIALLSTSPEREDTILVQNPFEA